MSNTSELVKEVVGLDHFHEIINRSEYSAFDVWATWCPPCRIMGPIFDKLAKTHPQVGFYKIDNDEEEEIVHELNVKGLPVFYLFKDGKQVGMTSGAYPSKLQEMIAKASIVAEQDGDVAKESANEPAPTAEAGAPNAVVPASTEPEKQPPEAAAKGTVSTTEAPAPTAAVAAPTEPKPAATEVAVPATPAPTPATPAPTPAEAAPATVPAPASAPPDVHGPLKLDEDF